MASTFVVNPKTGRKIIASGRTASRLLASHRAQEIDLPRMTVRSIVKQHAQLIAHREQTGGQKRAKAAAADKAQYTVEPIDIDGDNKMDGDLVTKYVNGEVVSRKFVPFEKLKRVADDAIAAANGGSEVQLPVYQNIPANVQGTNQPVMVADQTGFGQYVKAGAGMAVGSTVVGALFSGLGSLFEMMAAATETGSVTLMVHGTNDTMYGFSTLKGILEINTDSSPKTQLARLVFLSKPGPETRTSLGLIKRHPDFAWATAAMTHFVDSFMLWDDDGESDPLGSWVMDNAEAFTKPVLVKILDWDDWQQPSRQSKPDIELLAALRNYAEEAGIQSCA
ncbi:hypothetical protein HXX76_014138 [Chlamydomonas incerta]|uniref:Uncharacterized protein n=1 Tax=Chlamydomonas incerta TaxID=51695 RepID=A0A835SQJ9_CHLIN|nr:hypothetical protein HXX76_014138 [Chlamydomonas incerta]|eukprot:KAG2424980.1 hypothetical protein HXX76_014138 [Chlamydomonas incerta]